MYEGISGKLTLVSVDSGKNVALVNFIVLLLILDGIKRK